MHDDASPCSSAELLEGLTEPQREAVEHLDGPLLVLAGPGSGKTTVVTRRIANLIGQGIPPWQILAVTFTNKAAGEMRERVERMVPEGVPGRRGLTIATFHAFCARLLRRYGEAAGVGPRFSIYDSADQRAAIKQAIKDADLAERNFTPASIGAAISDAKNRLLDADAYAAQATDFYSRQIARAFTAYQKILRRHDALDFDDLLVVSARLLRTNDAVRGELTDRYQYLLVDEYQDTNHAQFVLCGALGAEHRNVCVVGDPDQSIYGWRGADIRNILEFEEQYPEAKVIPLGQNFRSTGHIVRAADHLIQHNARRKHKTLHTELGDGEMPEVVICRDEWHEASLITDTCRRLRDEEGVPWKEMAVLYRVNALSRVLEEAFRDAQIPYVIARGTAFYERKEVKDALAYLRLLANPGDDIALRRIVNVPPRGLGKTSLDRIEMYGQARGLSLLDALRDAASVPALTARARTAATKFAAMVDGWRAAAGGPDAPPGDLSPVRDLADLVERVVRESGLEAQYRGKRNEEDLERLENLSELINAAAQFEPVGEVGFDGGMDAATSAGEAASPDGGPAPGDPPAPTAADRSVFHDLAAYLESVALVSDADAIDPANGAVTLLTLHAAKGLEFAFVAMVGLESGLLPHMRALESEAEMEEERRLCFVGITRARKHLMLTRAGVRTHRGMRERTIESRFLDELPSKSVLRSDQSGDGLHWEADDGSGSGWGGGGRSGRGSRGGAFMVDLPEGALVEHPTFGVGRVQTVTPRATGASARIAFDAVGTKTLILEYAKLRRLDL